MRRSTRNTPNGAVGQRQRKRRHLVHQQDRHGLRAQAVQCVEQFVDDLGRQAQRRFVQQQDDGLGHQAAGNRQHLLFAA